MKHHVETDTKKAAHAVEVAGDIMSNELAVTMSIAAQSGKVDPQQAAALMRTISEYAQAVASYTASEMLARFKLEVKRKAGG